MLNLQKIDKPYVIAEIGANHNGDIAIAKKMIDSAKQCGADAVKFQHFDLYNLCTQKNLDELDRGKVKLENVDVFRTPELGLHNVKEQIDKFSFSKDEMSDVRKYAKAVGIDFGCTTEDAEGAEFLKSINVDFIKLSSADVTNLSLLRAAVRTTFPIVVSTGMADLAEIDNVYRLFKSMNCHNFALLHCISIYPPRDEIVNLKFIETLKQIYDCQIGYSDHTLGFPITLAAIAKGAIIIEKHFTLDKKMPGWDHKVSADPDDLKIICNEGERIFRSLGSKYKFVSADEMHKRKAFRKSITTKKNFKKGVVITENNVAFKRPGTGISPDLLEYVCGRKVNKNIPEDTTLTWDDLE